MRIVLTGAPGTGKSGILTELAYRDWIVLPESFRWRSNILKLNDKDAASKTTDLDLLSIQAYMEDISIPSNKDSCFDRCAIDLVAYHRMFSTHPVGTKLMRVANRSAKNLDAAYFTLLDPLRYARDRLRNEDLQLASDLEKMLLSTYTDFGLAPQQLKGFSETDRAMHLCSVRRQHRKHSASFKPDGDSNV